MKNAKLICLVIKNSVTGVNVIRGFANLELVCWWRYLALTLFYCLSYAFGLYEDCRLSNPKQEKNVWLAISCVKNSDCRFTSNMYLSESRKNGPREKSSSKKWSPEKWSPRKMFPGKMVPRKMVPGKLVPRKLVPGKMVPGKLVPGKLRNEKPWVGRRASWCVRGMVGCKQSMKTKNSTTNPKLGDKPETRNQKIVGWASSIVVCVWNIRMWSIYENPKLDNKHKTRKQSQSRKQKIVGWALSVVVCVCVCVCVCVWNVRMWLIYENPKLDNKSSWTPSVFYSLLHM